MGAGVSLSLSYNLARQGLVAVFLEPRASRITQRHLCKLKSQESESFTVFCRSASFDPVTMFDVFPSTL